MPKKGTNYSGLKINMLTLIEPTKKRKFNLVVWKCQCDCGKICFYPGSLVKQGEIKSCGCAIDIANKARRKDHTGKKKGRLTFIRPIKEKRNGSIQWLLRCDCGKFVVKIASKILSKSSKIQSCGCLFKELRLDYDAKLATANVVWRRCYMDGCPFELFLEISQKNCHYCGCEPSRTYNLYNQNNHTRYHSDYQRDNGNFTYNGLDRIDSNGDHSPTNIVPCCWICNKMKADKTYNEFLIYIKTIFLHMKEIIKKLSPEGIE